MQTGGARGAVGEAGRRRCCHPASSGGGRPGSSPRRPARCPPDRVPVGGCPKMRAAASLAGTERRGQERERLQTLGAQTWRWRCGHGCRGRAAAQRAALPAPLLSALIGPAAGDDEGGREEKGRRGARPPSATRPAQPGPGEGRQRQRARPPRPADGGAQPRAEGGASLLLLPSLPSCVPAARNDSHPCHPGGRFSLKRTPPHPVLVPRNRGTPLPVPVLAKISCAFLSRFFLRSPCRKGLIYQPLEARGAPGAASQRPRLPLSLYVPLGKTRFPTP